MRASARAGRPSPPGQHHWNGDKTDQQQTGEQSGTSAAHDYFLAATCLSMTQSLIGMLSSPLIVPVACAVTAAVTG
jgi:hypothetical protein